MKIDKKFSYCRIGTLPATKIRPSCFQNVELQVVRYNGNLILTWHVLKDIERNEQVVGGSYKKTSILRLCQQYVFNNFY